MIKKFIHPTRGASLLEYGILAGLVSVVSITAIVGLGQEVDDTFSSSAAALAAADIGASSVASDPIVAAATSCQDHFDQGERVDGVYTINHNGGDMRVACHFEDGGDLNGGWTVVAHQLETSTVGWNNGIAVDRADAGYFDTGFSLSSAQIPGHTAMAVGRRDAGSMEILDAAAFTYSTGDIALQTVTGLRAGGQTYQIHRETNNYYDYHDPEQPYQTGGDWVNTLTFDLFGGAGAENTWAYSPQHPAPQARGYSYNGALDNTNDAQAWVIYVR